MKRVILVGLLAVLFIFPATGATGDGQTAITKPPARFGHSMVTVDNQVYVFGGEGNSSGTLLGYFPSGLYFDDLWRFQEAAKWEKQQASNPPPARKFHKTVVLNGKMYVLFGEDSQGEPLGDVWEYDPGGNTWTQKETSAPAKARSQHSAIVINGRVYVFGGLDSNGEKL